MLITFIRIDTFKNIWLCFSKSIRWIMNDGPNEYSHDKYLISDSKRRSNITSFL